MREDYILMDLPKELLSLKALEAKKANARLVQICAVNTENGFDLLYSFADNYHFLTYKIAIGVEEDIISISDIYPPAALYENEMMELFGVQVDYINLDYERQLYNIAEETPFRPKNKEEQNG